MDQALDWIFKRYQGLGFVAALLASLLAVASGTREAAREELTILAVWAAAFAFYWLGRFLDHPIYDRLFGVGGIWSRVLDRERDLVRARLRDLGWPADELFATSRALFEYSSSWEHEVSHSYEASKACRSFVIPLLLLFLYELIAPPLGLRPVLIHSPLGWKALVGVLLVVDLALYLGLRVRHNKKLYMLVAKADILSPQDFQGYDGRILHTDDVRSGGHVTYRFLALRGDLPVRSSGEPAPDSKQVSSRVARDAAP